MIGKLAVESFHVEFLFLEALKHLYDKENLEQNKGKSSITRQEQLEFKGGEIARISVEKLALLVRFILKSRIIITKIAKIRQPLSLDC